METKMMTNPARRGGLAVPPRWGSIPGSSPARMGGPVLAGIRGAVADHKGNEADEVHEVFDANAVGSTGCHDWNTNLPRSEPAPHHRPSRPE